MKYKIYTLSDPRTGEVKYVGKTCFPESRLTGHINASKGGHSPTNRWVASLLRAGVLPVFRVVASGVGFTCYEKERYWILRYSETCNLTNIRKTQSRGIGAQRRKREIVRNIIVTLFAIRQQKLLTD